MHIQELKELAMSRIDDLIAEYCPDGVEFHSISEIFDLKNGYTPSKSKLEYWTNGTVPWFRMEDIRANGHILFDSIQHVNQLGVKSGKLFSKDSVMVATSATIGEHALLKVDALTNQRFTVLTRKPEYVNRLLPEFINYYCYVLDEWCKTNVHAGGFASVDMEGFKRYRFPVPPLPVQEEIVRILDSFSSLEAELEAELEARRKQYAYYRNELLTFDRERVQWLKLGEAAFINKGTYITKKQVIPGNIPVILGGVEPAYWHSESNHDGEGIVISRSGANAGFASYWNEPIFVSDGFVLDAKPGIDMRFLFHVLKKQQAKLHSMKRGSGVPHINSKMLANNVAIPVPPLEEQQHVVSILDRFDKLTNDLSSGLPAEIEARRKQYEYYRDRLLSFDELAV